MSVKVMGQVWELDLSHAEQSVLLALADHAKHDGTSVYPSVDLVAWKTNYSKRQVQRIMSSLRKEGILVIVREANRYRPREYRIDLSKAKNKPPYNRGDKLSPLLDSGDSRGDSGDTPGVTRESTRGDTTMSPESSNNRQVNTSDYINDIVSIIEVDDDDDESRQHDSSSSVPTKQKPKIKRSSKPPKALIKTLATWTDLRPGNNKVVEAAAIIHNEGLGHESTIQDWVDRYWPDERPSNATRQRPWPSQVADGLRRRKEIEAQLGFGNLTDPDEVCAGCGAVVYPEDRICSECGRELETPVGEDKRRMETG